MPSPGVRIEVSQSCRLPFLSPPTVRGPGYAPFGLEHLVRSVSSLGSSVDESAHLGDNDLCPIGWATPVVEDAATGVVQRWLTALVPSADDEVRDTRLPRKV